METPGTPITFLKKKTLIVLGVVILVLALVLVILLIYFQGQVRKAGMPNQIGPVQYTPGVYLSWPANPKPVPLSAHASTSLSAPPNAKPVPLSPEAIKSLSAPVQ